MAFTAVLGGIGAVAGLLGSSSASKEANKLAKRSIKLQEQSLAMAKQQFELFLPVIKDTADFYSRVPLEDIVSGRVLTTEGRAALERLGQAEFGLSKLTEQNLARRGIQSDFGSVALANQIRLGNRQARSRAVSESVQAEIQNRLNATNTGLNIGQSVLNQQNQLAGSLSQQAGQQQQIAAQSAQAAGAGLATLATSLDQRPTSQLGNVVEDSTSNRFTPTPTNQPNTLSRFSVGRF